jgi:salicylate hydroxylase
LSAIREDNGDLELQAMSRANKIRFHIPDGPEQQERDAESARVSDRAPGILRWLYDHDPAQPG